MDPESSFNKGTGHTEDRQRFLREFRHQRFSWWSVLKHPHYITHKELSEYRRILDSDGFLVHDADREIATLLPLLRDAFNSQFGNEVGIDRLDKFFNSFTPDRVLVNKPQDYEKLASELINTSVKIDDGVRAFRGSYHGYSGLIFMDSNMIYRGNRTFESFLTEEIVHAFLDSVLTERQKNRLIKKTKPDNSASDNDSDPTEQIAKYIRLKLLGTIYPDQNFYFSDRERSVAEAGFTRIQKLGWRRVLRGVYGKPSAAY